jgi:hypothetical protein
LYKISKDNLSSLLKVRVWQNWPNSFVLYFNK